MNSKNVNFEEEKARRRNIQEAKLNMYMSKRQGVQSVREQLRQDAMRKETNLIKEQMHNQNQRETVKQMVLKAKQSVAQYRVNKSESNRAELKAKTEHEKQLIYKFEREAQELERMEE